MNELFEIAILAYRSGKYRDAIELLMQVNDCDATNWLAKLYLAMSYEKSGRVADAHRLYKRMAGECTDEHIRNKAENTIPLLEAEMRRRFQKDPLPAGAGKKQSGPDYGDDAVWFG